MSDEIIHGVVQHQGIERKADYLYRLSIKGLIVNEQGEVLVVKEAGRNYWDLPGGGMDHGETIKQAIARELYEEVGLQGDFTYQIIAIEDPALLRHAGVLQVRLVFRVSPQVMDFAPGEDGDEVSFIRPELLKDSSIFAEHKVYEYAQLV